MGKKYYIEDDIKYFFEERVKKRMLELSAKEDLDTVTQVKLSEDAEMSHSTLSSYLAGEKSKMPSLYNAYKIARALDVSLDYLAGGDGGKTLPSKIESSEVFLRNLCAFLVMSKCKIRFGEGETTFSTTDPQIALFLKEISDLKNYRVVEATIKRFSYLKIWKGRLVSQADYEIYEKQAFIYDGIIDGVYNPEYPPIDPEGEEFKEHPEEVQEEIERRNEIWEELKRGRRQ